MTGSLTAVGTGPGDPDLVTIGAIQACERADHIFAFAANDAGSRSATIMQSHIASSIEIEIVTLPMRPDPSYAEPVYDSLVEQLQVLVANGKHCVVLCEGDPLFFGSFNAILSRWSDRDKLEVIPGITSMALLAANWKVPLASKTSRLSILPATADEAELDAALKNHDALIVMKPGRHAGKLRRLFDKHGLADRVLYAEQLGTDRERLCHWNELNPSESLPYFSILMVPPQ